MKLTVITQDYISAWEKKGEILNGYFNPQNEFDSIDIILLNDDIPTTETLSALCGDASIRYYNFPLLTKKAMLITLGWQPLLVDLLMKPLISWALSEPTDVVRAYETNLSAYCAMRISKVLGCNYAISLHSTPDKKALRLYSTTKDRLVRRMTRRAGLLGFKGSTVLIAVYQTILTALSKENREKAVLIPNVVGINSNNQKESYKSKGPIQLLATGRLVHGKSPEKFILALSTVQNIELTIVGDGPLKGPLTELVTKLNLQERVKFIGKIDNRLLCKKLKDFDAYVFHTDYQECPKTFIEAALVGLPIVCSEELQIRIPELRELSLLTYINNARGITEVFRQVSNEKLRFTIGQKISNDAVKLWSPEATSLKTAEVLTSLAQKK